MVKSKVFYGQEPPSGQSTTTESAFNYQLLAVITEVAQWGAISCNRPQPATDNGVRDGRSNWLVALPTLHRAVPLSSTYYTVQCGCKSQDLLHSVSRERATFGMPGQRTACATTQGVKEKYRSTSGGRYSGGPRLLRKEEIQDEGRIKVIQRKVIRDWGRCGEK